MAWHCTGIAECVHHGCSRERLIKIANDESNSAPPSRTVHSPHPPFRSDATHRNDSQAGARQKWRIGRDVYRPCQFFSANRRTKGLDRPKLCSLVICAKAVAAARSEN